ncbi:hypothetical protein G6514_003912 [Epicoccum nigrum]|nr:hypothetical protein G6514_003912 [Epicoccum nigrum]
MVPPSTRSKRKRTNGRDEHNSTMAVDSLMNSPGPSTGDEMITTPANKSRHDSLENDREVKDPLPPSKRLHVNEGADIELSDCLMKAMRTALETQNRACEKLLMLTDKLHKWAPDLDEQERWLYKTECQHVKLDHTVTKKTLDAAAGYMKRLENTPQPHQGKRASSIATQVQPCRLLVDLLESNMEVLISELQNEKQAREHAEKKLRAKEQGE